MSKVQWWKSSQESVGSDGAFPNYVGVLFMSKEFWRPHTKTRNRSEIYENTSDHFAHKRLCRSDSHVWKNCSLWSCLAWSHTNGPQISNPKFYFWKSWIMLNRHFLQQRHFSGQIYPWFVWVKCLKEFMTGSSQDIEKNMFFWTRAIKWDPDVSSLPIVWALVCKLTIARYQN